MTSRNKFTILAVALSYGVLMPGCWRFCREEIPISPPVGVLDLTADPGTGGRISPYHPETPEPVGPPPGRTAANEPVPVPTVSNEPEPLPAPTAPAELPQTSPTPLPSPIGQFIPSPIPPPPEAPIEAALRYLRDNRPEEAIETLKRYDQPNQDVLLVLLPLAERLTHGNLNQASPHEVAHVLEQFKSLEAQLRPRAPLLIEKMRFCCPYSIRNIGEYDPLPEDYVFRAGRGGHDGEEVHFYIELQNVSSRLNGIFYETVLTRRLEICDAQGKIVWAWDVPAKTPRRSYTSPRDCFIAGSFPVPGLIPPGRYTLRVEVKDVTFHLGKEVPPHRVARSELDFRISTTGTRVAPVNGDRVSAAPSRVP
jgi:hypothetical protein